MDQNISSQATGSLNLPKNFKSILPRWAAMIILAVGIISGTWDFFVVKLAENCLSYYNAMRFYSTEVRIMMMIIFSISLITLILSTTLSYKKISSNTFFICGLVASGLAVINMIVTSYLLTTAHIFPIIGLPFITPLTYAALTICGFILLKNPYSYAKSLGRGLAICGIVLCAAYIINLAANLFTSYYTRHIAGMTDTLQIFISYGAQITALYFMAYYSTPQRKGIVDKISPVRE